MGNMQHSVYGSTSKERSKHFIASRTSKVTKMPALSGAQPTGSKLRSPIEKLIIHSSPCMLAVHK